jgi:putative nucleotidyltransferase with HDIG domain
VRGHHNYTCVHSLRVATYRSIFGHAIGVLGDDLLTLSTGGLLHDVGKMVTPQDVLNKNSKLDDDEWVCMKEHVNNSSAVYDRTPDISQGIRIIGEQHHEKLNGTGYPRGLKGSELNELARMSAIVDIFGALND